MVQEHQAKFQEKRIKDQAETIEKQRKAIEELIENKRRDK
jgi:plasmid maintenance system antidote protein VapI|tara:strand:+ start:2795 stop:2914 length:120 start_codon:yes stop_codon:yes gene_type:complete